jgi:alkylation response protein AidB-like acyl-CoA dehydrogenase
MAAPTYLNNRAWTIFGGSNEVQRTIIATTVLGL